MFREESKAVRSALGALGDGLAPFGFAPSRATFFVRTCGEFVEFIHVHKFRDALESYTPKMIASCDHV
jgi:hypothetical protein